MVVKESCQARPIPLTTGQCGQSRFWHAQVPQGLIRLIRGGHVTGRDTRGRHRGVGKVKDEGSNMEEERSKGKGA